MSQKQQEIATPLKSIHFSNNPSFNLNFISKHIHSQQSIDKSVLPNINNIRSTFLRESLSYLYSDRQPKEKAPKYFTRANTRQIQQNDSKIIYPVGTSLNAIRFKKSDSKTIQKKSSTKIAQIPKSKQINKEMNRMKLRHKSRNSARAEEENIFTIKKYGQWNL